MTGRDFHNYTGELKSSFCQKTTSYKERFHQAVSGYNLTMDVFIVCILKEFHPYLR
jgi:hypothetical protein